MYRFLESVSNFRLTLAKSVEIRKQIQLFISRKFEFKIQVPRIFFYGKYFESEKHFDECTLQKCTIKKKIAHAAESLRAALQFRATRKLKDRIIRTLKVHLVMLE